MRKAWGAALCVTLLCAFPAQAAAEDEATLDRYARATWKSFVAMTDSATGLPTDKLERDRTRSVQTSTTNIGAYMWSAVAAERLGIIGHDELCRAAGADDRDARADGAPSRPRASTTTGTTTAPAPS